MCGWPVVRPTIYHCIDFAVTKYIRPPKKMRFDPRAKSGHFWRKRLIIKNAIIFRSINFFSLNGNAVISLMDSVEIHQRISEIRVQ